MIKNLVFDFGKVLVHFEPFYMAGLYAQTEADAELLARVVFDRAYWDKLDAGTITDEEVVALCKERLPQRLHNAAEQAYCQWIYNLPEIDGMRELLEWIKEQYGIPLYLLSNISEYFADRCAEISVLKLFDKCIFSAKVDAVKPSFRIFDILCKECNLVPEETLFIDDSPKNTEGARAFGMNSYLFDGDAKRLKSYIEKHLMIE